ncbi:MAG: hypothetical protein DRP57_09655 [Spirochaetes bacterium]|nr:MAG: hypothetical protein DRP57_09655 [Spirochaetota bacterium]
MLRDLEKTWENKLLRLKKVVKYLENEVKATERTYSGLKDITQSLKLANACFSLCLHYLDGLKIHPNKPETITEKDIYNGAKQSANKGLNTLESLLKSEISGRDRAGITADPEYIDAKEKLKNILLKGGGSFFEGKTLTGKRLKIISRALASSIQKFSIRDDNSPPPKIEKYPKFLRDLVNVLFPVLLRPNQKPPPYGIEEGEEKLYKSEKIKMPLSQAVLYYEEDFLPRLKKKLAENPGNTFLQQQIYSVKKKAEEYKRLKFIPRSTPIVMEKNFYTDWISSYTQNGELLVNVPVPAEISSKTNTDRVMELVRMDFVKNIAGKGIFRELDMEYSYLKSLKSGIRGSSRTASLKIDTEKGYIIVKREIPYLACLENKNDFITLTQRIKGQPLKETYKYILKQLTVRGLKSRANNLLPDL